MIALTLRKFGARVDSASNVAKALAYLEEGFPQLLISDIAMPGADGYELIARVREMEVLRGGMMPAIALTAYVRESERQQALEAGFQMHLSKPVEVTLLIAGIANLAGMLADPEPTDSAVETPFLTPQSRADY